jgi:hypothetical protein
MVLFYLNIIVTSVIGAVNGSCFGRFTWEGDDAKAPAILHVFYVENRTVSILLDFEPTDRCHGLPFSLWNTNYFSFILFIDLSSSRWRCMLVI